MAEIRHKDWTTSSLSWTSSTVKASTLRGFALAAASLFGVQFVKRYRFFFFFDGQRLHATAGCVKHWAWPWTWSRQPHDGWQTHLQLSWMNSCCRLVPPATVGGTAALHPGSPALCFAGFEAPPSPPPPTHTHPLPPPSPCVLVYTSVSHGPRSTKDDRNEAPECSV